MLNLPYITAQVDAAPTIATLATLLMSPQGIAAILCVVVVALFWQNQKLHSEHVTLLQQVLPVSAKLAEAVERLEKRLDKIGA